MADQANVRVWIKLRTLRRLRVIEEVQDGQLAMRLGVKGDERFGSCSTLDA